MFIHVGSRRVFVSPSTFHPTEAWVKQQARNVGMWLDEEGLPIGQIVHDRNTKFTEGFDRVFQATGVAIVKTPFQSPIANAFAESWIGSLKRECLNHFGCFSLGHLDHIVQAYVAFYNRHRPHQSLDNRPLMAISDPIPLRATESPPSPEEVGPVRRHTTLGGLLNHYERKAA